MDAREHSYQSLSPLVRAPAEYVALLGGSDILQEEEAAIELGVAPAAVALGNRSEESLPELAMKEQFALDRVRFLLLDDERHAPASLTLGDDAMRTAAQAVLDTDSCGAHDLQVAMPPVRRCEETAAEPCRIEDGLVRRNLHALTVCGEPPRSCIP